MTLHFLHKTNLYRYIYYKMKPRFGLFQITESIKGRLGVFWLDTLIACLDKSTHREISLLMICVSVWAAGGELRPGLWSVLRDEAAHLRGRGQCQPVSSDVRNTFCFQVTTNTTQLQNPSFPATYSVGGTCVYLVKRQSDNICQIRSGTSWS